MEEHGLLHDTHFWVLLATILFVVVAFIKGKGPLLALLDARTAKIKADLEEAARLRAAAAELLADGQRKHRDAIQTAQKIVDNAKEATVRMQQDAERKLDESMKRREAQLTDRIARAEASAVQELRIQAADLAARAAEKLVAEALAKNSGKLVEDAIRELPARLN